MPLETDTSNWSGEGVFTQLLIERLGGIDAVRFVKIDDAPATRSEADYNFISNELFVRFATVDRQEPVKRFGILPSSRTVTGPVMTLAELATALTAMADVGEPDYGDEGMLQIPPGRANRAGVSDARLQAGRTRPNLRSRYPRRS